MKNTKTVLITGASGAIGSAIGRKFFLSGFNVALHYHKNYDNANNLKKELNTFAIDNDLKNKAEIFSANVGDSADVSKMFSEIRSSLGDVDVLVNNAGGGTQILFSDITDELWREIFALNVDGCFYCCKEALPHMIHEKQGKIINISSIWGVTGASCEVHYSAAKAAIIGLTKALAKELGPSGINVNCVAPGVIDTPMNAHLSEEAMNELKEETPLCRIGTPEDVANAVYFLASDDASFITGQVLGANGGFVI
jgi:3-oxoacyl-[acyl-carrier protein] reductase